MRITEAVQHALSWIATWHRNRAEAREVLRQYRAMTAECPRAIADLLKFCLVHDDISAPGDVNQTFINIGKRQTGLHLLAMIDLRPDELQSLRGLIEDDN